MTVDRDIRGGDTRSGCDAPVPVPVSRTTVFWYLVFATILFGWFLWGWLVTGQGFVDSVGESAGTAFALLLLVSIVGTVRQSRRH
ncbi:hypothetical protein [Plantactinospora sp. GCM10030261]|uniref:hypothetical protein n=1 Tax=Plantactinospora sp. GCM10030261 TaxID=3273420 RepID=UPI00361635E5